MSERSIILHQPTPDGDVLVLTATPELTRISVGATGLILHETIEARREQPGSPIHAESGALIGDNPFSDMSESEER